MAVFAYSGTDASGVRRTGFVDAASAKAARQDLSSRGIVAETLSAPELSGVADFGWRTRFYESLGMLLKAGFPIDAALGFLADETSGKAQGAILVALDSIREGKPLDAAIGAISPSLPPFERATLEIADKTGSQGAMLVRLSGFMEADARVREKIRSAMAYPAAVFCFALLLLAVVALGIVPRAAALFPADSIPRSVRILRIAAPVALAALVAATAAVARFFAVLSKRGGNGEKTVRRESLLLSLPVFRRLVPLLWASRYAGTMSLLLEAGLSPQTAIVPAGTATGSVTVAAQAAETAEAVKGGAPLSKAMAAMAPIAPLLAAWMAVGEKTGALAEMLERAAERLRNEYERLLHRALSFLEPALIAIVGIAVLAVALGVLRPMLDLTTGIGS